MDFGLLSRMDVKITSNLCPQSHKLEECVHRHTQDFQNGVAKKNFWVN